MKRALLVAVTAAAAGALLFTPALHAQVDPAAAVEQRQNLMKGMGGAFPAIFQVLQDQTTDLTDATAAAARIRDNITEAATLFVEGTGVGEIPGARAKPEVWSDSANFAAAAKALADAADALANAGDVGTFKAAFPAVGQTCGGCHESAGSAGGKYRAPAG